LVVLVVVLPLLLSFLVWTVLRWRRQRRRFASAD
jgi:preprotein translocase subunit YajC